MRRIGRQELQPVFDRRGVSIDNLYFGIEGKPDGTSFAVPISVVVRADVEPGEYPVVYEIDSATGEATPVISTILADPDRDFIMMSLHHFTELTVEQIAENKRGEEHCKEDPCACKGIKVKSKSKGTVCQDKSSNCQIIEAKEEVEYLDCGKNIQEFSGLSRSRLYP